MSVVIGLKSGKEFVVDDKSYSFVNTSTGLITKVFTSIQEKRVITIPPDGLIEFYNEPLKADTIKHLDQAITTPVKAVETIDPNVG